MSTLNDQQNLAVGHFHGPCLVSACPGAGKTRVIASRAISLISKGIDPSRILLVTFTNKASREMSDRILKLASESSVSHNGISVSTFHRMCLDIVRKSSTVNKSYKYLNIIDQDDVESLLKSIAEDHSVSMEKEDLQSFKYLYDSLREKALNQEDIKDELEKINPEYVQLMILYDSAMSNIGAVDFSGIMYNFWKELQVNSEFRLEVQRMFDFLMIDEVQDTNIIQFEIAKIISEMHNNIFMVGDTDQSIYQWRGANPSQVSIFIKSSLCKVYHLSKNYRCTGNIVEAASSLISYNPNRLNTKIDYHRESGSPVSLSVLYSREEESNHIVRGILKLRSSGSSLKDIAVLVRASYLTRSIEQAMMKGGIPYSITGGFRFYDREEIKDIISMLKFVNNPKDVISFSRFMNKPRRGLGGKCVQAINSSSLRGGISNGLYSYLSTCSDMNESHKASIGKLVEKMFSKPVSSVTLAELANHLIESTQYMDYIKTFKGDIPDDKSDNIKEFIKSMDGVQQSLSEFLNSIALMSAPQESTEEDMVNSIKIMTMHSAKGLEFKNVFLPCFEEQLLPHRRSIENGGEGLEEERRLAYVAMTRAMDRLFISTCMVDGRRDMSIKMPSRFLFESNLTDREKYSDLVQQAKSAYMV